MNKEDIEFKVRRILIKMRMYREIKFVTQAEAAKGIGVALRTFQRIESGEASFDILFLFRFCNYFGVEFEKLTSSLAPPLIPNIKLFITKDEQDSFFHLPDVIESNFQTILNLFTNQILHINDIANNADFQNFPYMLVVYNNNNNNKYFDKKAVQEMVFDDSTPKTFKNSVDTNYVSNLIDNIYYYLPVYAVVDPTRIITAKNNRTLFSYIRYYYTKENEMISIGLLKFH